MRFFPVLIICLLCGCTSRIPEPVTFPYSQQQKMQASQHWQVLAEDLANRINNELILTDNSSKAVFVKQTCGDEATPCGPAETSSFNEAFRDLLITNLVGFGIPTKKQKDQETIEILYKVQLVRHTAERIRTLQPGLLTWLSAAIVVFRNVPTDLLTVAAGAATDVANTSLTNNEHYEIIITTSLVNGGKYLFRASDIYYINDKDFWHYQERMPQTRTITLSSSEKTKARDADKPLPVTVRPAPEPAPLADSEGKKEL
jgi:hypothetical protein